EAEKKWPPAVFFHEQSADQCTECRSGLGARVDQGVGESAMVLGEVVGEDAGVRRVRYRFADAEYQAEGEEDGEGLSEAGNGRGAGPKEEGDREDPRDVAAIDQPAGEAGELKEGVGPEEAGAEQAEVGIGQVEVPLDIGRADR